ncbi:hypothetical protein F0L17_26625 [Streptomyces sp. TRM43335]|uniref:Uncharacterized protein n=1 Tax=Streptomyces taklimakanensis TaxID=2569853 RepID=A0A6G2BKF8_9ACTN|nr:hypothetical protein [Streptomyces taklimakanensis]MTE22606.1 hypothetical protein [Streptomyces taklimakanensis]
MDLSRDDTPHDGGELVVIETGRLPAGEPARLDRLPDGRMRLVWDDRQISLAQMQEAAHRAYLHRQGTTGT